MSEPTVDLENVIADAVNDSLDETPEVEASSEETPQEPVEASTSDSVETPAEEPAESNEVPSPASVEASKAIPEAPQDDFAKLAGVAPTGVGGRENRIPYSRVKKITEKAVGELAEAALGRKLNPGEKATDVVKAHVAQLPELQAKVTDYESRLDAVGKFEDVMANEPEKFLRMLARIPAYKEFFDFVEQASKAAEQPNAAPATPEAPAAVELAPMPEPDEESSDGSKYYSMEGLKKLLDWNAQVVEARLAPKYENRYNELEKRYAPVASYVNERQRVEAALPLIRKQIDEARKWERFNESEEEILAVLSADKTISLQTAYQKVVWPKLLAERDKVVTDREKIRQEVIKELQTAPTATSVPNRAVVKPGPAASTGPRKLEDVIKDSLSTIQK